MRSDDVDLGGSRVGVRQSIAGFHLELLDHDERVRTVGLDDLYTERLGP